jgi:iron complex transport system substrate-binding protein
MTLRQAPLRAVAFAVLTVVSACAPATRATPDATQAPPSSTPSPITPAPSFPVTLTDDAGREVTIAAEPERIVSLAPSNTEIACALGACSALAGVPEFLDGYPPEVLQAVADLPKVVAFGPVDRELITSLEPDLVLAAGNELTPSDDIDALTELGLAVLVLYPESLEEVYADIALVGEATGRGAEAVDLVTDLRRHASAVQDAVSGLDRPRTFYEVSIFEGVIYTAGEGSFLASLIDLAGGEPITGDALATSIGLEELLAADPELILLGDAAYDPSITPQSIAQRPGWGETSAVRSGRVIPMPDDLIITRPGPRIVDGLEALARAIHPEAFD